MTRALARGLWLGIALGAILPMLPLPEGIGGTDRGPLWTPHVEAWAIGLVAVLAIAAIAARIDSRRGRG